VSAEFVPASLLSRAVRWVHQVGPDGASAEVLLPDGRRITSTAVRGTLNRMVRLWPPPTYSRSPDGNYALQELLALYVSLLRCLPPPMLNRPSPQGLSGRMRYTPDWFVVAARAGFATVPYAASSRHEDGARDGDRSAELTGAVHHAVIVAAGRVFGDPVATKAAAAACRMARLAQVELLGLRLATTADGAAWFEAADLYPDLRTGGEQLVDHLADLVPAREPR
jgi:hypothetical protein